MVGRARRARARPRRRSRPAHAALAVDGLTVVDAAACRALNGVSLDVATGEIVGIAGVAGNGQSELLAAIAGIVPIDSGRTCSRRGRDRPRAARRRDRGLGHVPEDRLRMGLVLDFNAAELLDPRLHRAGELQSRPAAWTAARDRSARQRADQRIRRAARRTGALRCSLFRAATSRSSSARASCRARLRSFSSASRRAASTSAPSSRSTAGSSSCATPARAILLVSVELDEILTLADRILVMFDGEIVGETRPETSDERHLGLLMAGVRDAA